MTVSVIHESSTRDKILAAAHRVFLKAGITASSTQDIANEAGVNKALIHYYFGTKNGLASAVFSEVHAQVFPELFRILADPERSIERKVHEIVDLQLNVFSARPYIPGFVAAEVFSNPGIVAELIARAQPPSLEPLQQQLDVAACAGLIRPVRAEQFVFALLGAITMPFVMRPMFEKVIKSQSGSFEAFIADRRSFLADFFLNGLRP